MVFLLFKLESLNWFYLIQDSKITKKVATETKGKVQSDLLTKIDTKMDTNIAKKNSIIGESCITWQKSNTIPSQQQANTFPTKKWENNF